MTNVLFLVVDSLRYDAVAGDAFVTPTLDALADVSVSFSRCFSQGISTAPAMTAMLTGRYPLDYGGHWYIEKSQPTVAEQFQRNGYTTGAIHSNPNVSRRRNFHRGFDTFEENIVPFDTNRIISRIPDAILSHANKAARILSRTPYMPIDEVNTHHLDWLEATEQPWFLWTQYMDTHGPYLPGDDFTYRNKFRAERLWRKAAVNAPEEVTDEEHEELLTNYRREVEYLDRELGEFLDELDRRGHLKDTVVIIVGDHGDEFGEHGQYGHSNLPYDELTHVPLLMRFPDSTDIDQPTEVDSLVRIIDILPTTLDLVDAELSDEMVKRMVGESLLPIVRGAEPTYDTVVTEKEVRGEDFLRIGFRTERWKYLFDGEDGDDYLYNLEDDPNESVDVTDQHPETVRRFRERLSERIMQIEATASNRDALVVHDHPGVEEQLRALGYR